MTNKTQHNKFKEVARQLECDEDEKHFDSALKKVVKPESKKKEGKKGGQ